jgi:hypothetical protein
MSDMQEFIEANPLFAQAKIRVHVATQQASVIDVVMMITGKKSCHAGAVVSNLPQELIQNLDQLRINGKGRETWVADAPTCVEVIWELPGKAAKAFRRQSAHYICRILGGDRTLIEEIETRFERTNEEQKQFMIANVERPVLPDRTETEELRVRKRKLEDLDIAEREVRLKQSLLDVKQSQLDVRRCDVDLNIYFKTLLSTDAEVVAAMNDNIKQIAMNVHIDKSSPFLPDFSQIVYELSGRVLPIKELSTIGKVVSQAYKKVHGCTTPHKVMRYCNGANRMVNAYSIDEKELVYTAVQSYLK